MAQATPPSAFPFHAHLLLLAQSSGLLVQHLGRQALQGASFTSAQQLRRAIDDFVAVYNPKAAPFEWKKAVVFSSGPKHKYPNLCN